MLGCGAAPGVPSLSRGWGQCNPTQPRNRRSRASILVSPRAGEAATALPILVDTSPDLRSQLLDAGTSHLSAVLYTHDHADHLHGLDDLREVNRAMKAALDIHGSAETLDTVRTRFSYAVTPLPPKARSIFKPLLVPHEIDGPFDCAGVPITPVPQDHGVMATLGFRFGDALAYSTDVMALDVDALEALRGVHTWIVGCIAWSPHPTHAHVGKVLEWADVVQPQRLVLTHLGLGLDYDALNDALPAGAEAAYDGMVLDAPLSAGP